MMNTVYGTYIIMLLFYSLYVFPFFFSPPLMIANAQFHKMMLEILFRSVALTHPHPHILHSFYFDLPFRFVQMVDLPIIKIQGNVESGKIDSLFC